MRRLPVRQSTHIQKTHTLSANFKIQNLRKTKNFSKYLHWSHTDLQDSACKTSNKITYNATKHMLLHFTMTPIFSYPIIILLLFGNFLWRELIIMETELLWWHQGWLLSSNSMSLSALFLSHLSSSPLNAIIFLLASRITSLLQLTLVKGVSYCCLFCYNSYKHSLPHQCLFILFLRVIKRKPVLKMNTYCSSFTSLVLQSTDTRDFFHTSYTSYYRKLHYHTHGFFYL